VNGKMIKLMAMESIFTVTVQDITVNGKMINSMALAQNYGQIAVNTKGIM